VSWKRDKSALRILERFGASRAKARAAIVFKDLTGLTPDEREQTQLRHAGTGPHRRTLGQKKLLLL
jgi:hypothetical protein